MSRPYTSTPHVWDTDRSWDRERSLRRTAAHQRGDRARSRASWRQRLTYLLTLGRYGRLR